MADLTVVTPARSNVEAAGAAAAAGGDKFVNTGKEILVIDHTNAAGADVTLTITTTATMDGEAVADKTITITKGKRYAIGPFPQNVYNDGDNKVSLAYSDHTDIEVAIVKG